MSSHPKLGPYIEVAVQSLSEEGSALSDAARATQLQQGKSLDCHVIQCTNGGPLEPESMGGHRPAVWDQAGMSREWPRDGQAVLAAEGELYPF